MALEGGGFTAPLVVVVEDNPVNSEMVIEFLKHRGFRSELVMDGRLAADRIASVCPNIVLMDVQLPGKSGLEVIRELREVRGLKGLPIVAVTAQAMKGDRERCLEAGADAYMSKPVSLLDLERLINQLLELHADGH